MVKELTAGQTISLMTNGHVLIYDHCKTYIVLKNEGKLFCFEVVDVSKDIRIKKFERKENVKYPVDANYHQEGLFD